MSHRETAERVVREFYGDDDAPQRHPRLRDLVEAAVREAAEGAITQPEPETLTPEEHAAVVLIAVRGLEYNDAGTVAQARAIAERIVAAVRGNKTNTEET